MESEGRKTEREKTEKKQENELARPLFALYSHLASATTEGRSARVQSLVSNSEMLNGRAGPNEVGVSSEANGMSRREMGDRGVDTTALIVIQTTVLICANSNTRRHNEERHESNGKNRRG